MTHTIEIQHVESQLEELLSAVLAGDEVVLTQEKRPVARLTPVNGAQPAHERPRIAGLHEGAMSMSDDFDEYLGDEFWFGES